MTTRSSDWLAPALVAAVLILGGCSGANASSEEPAQEPAATVEVVNESEPARIQLSTRAVQRLGIKTTPVVSLGTGAKSTLVVPYAAVIYDADGQAWAFAVSGPGTYRRQSLVIGSINQDVVKLTAGPPVGTEVVIVGASELVGAEAGISGEE